MPLSRPLAPFRPQPLTKSPPRKQAMTSARADTEAAGPSVKASRKSIRVLSTTSKPGLRVLRSSDE
jgi:hypothetical protein